MQRLDTPSKRKKIALISILVIVVVIGFLRFVPISSKDINCYGGNYRIIKGELDEYNYINQPSQESLMVMGVCALTPPVRLYVL